MIAFDTVGLFQKSDRGNRYPLFSADYFIMWLHVYATPTKRDR